MMLVAPSASRNSCSSTHSRRTTTSSRIIATCAAGPPNPRVPIFRKTPATSRMLAIGRGRFRSGRGIHVLRRAAHRLARLVEHGAQLREHGRGVETLREGGALLGIDGEVVELPLRVGGFRR